MKNVCRKLENENLKSYSSMKTGGNAKELYLPETREQLEEVLVYLIKQGDKFVVLGNMSNVLVPDEGIDVPVIITTSMRRFEIVSQNDKKALVYADSGMSLTKFSMDMCKMGFSDISVGYGIPGTVGGGVYMNAGAYDGELSSVVKEVYAIDTDGNRVTLSNEQCAFSYRESVFMKKELYITGALFEFDIADSSALVENAKTLMSKRAEKQPLEYPSCGSTFKRPEGYFAGALIEQAQLKGKCVGGACVSQKHAGFVINKCNATTDDVLSLMRFVRKTVEKNSGVTLEAEIRLIGKDGEYFEL